MRWMYVKQNPADNLKFGYGPAKESERKLMNLWNSFTFFKTYASGNSKIENLKLKIENSNLPDKWILSRLNNLIGQVAESMDKYDPAFASRAIEEFFINDLSLWHIRRSRERFQRPKSKKEKEEAVKTLYLVLLNLAKVISPFLPFLSEEIYLFLKKGSTPESVHLCDWPKADKRLIDLKLEKQMGWAREISAKGLALRAKAGIKVRQPLAKFQIPRLRQGFGGQAKSKIIDELLNLVKDEVNVKEIAFGKKFELDTKITPELKEEGIIRELTRQIQGLRRDGGLKPKDLIIVYVKIEDEKLKTTAKRFQKTLAKSVNAKSIEFTAAVKDGLLADHHFELEGQPIWIGVKKI